MPRTKQPDIYVAKNGFHCDFDGERLFIPKGERVRNGHPLLRIYSDYFEPADTRLRYDVEQATAAPGEKRGA
jgi:hypothetical protein